MENEYERLAEDMGKVAANLVQLMHRLPFDMRMARGSGGAQVAHDCMALERVSLRLINQVFSGKRSDMRPWLRQQDDPCVRAAQSLQCVFTNIGRLGQAAPFLPVGNCLSDDIATLLRMAATLLKEDLAQMLEARTTQVTGQLAARDWCPTQRIVEDVSETGQSDPSLGVLATSAEVQAATLEAMLNFTYVAQPEIASAAENPLVAGNSAPRQRWRKFVSVIRKIS
jgi:hypothetical protein